MYGGKDIRMRGPVEGKWPKLQISFLIRPQPPEVKGHIRRTNCGFVSQLHVEAAGCESEKIGHADTLDIHGYAGAHKEALCVARHWKSVRQAAEAP
ncbi:hypothetical protein CVS30_01315 [Arthrobacter psychrolactophilus]|uniref:Uncharacterized protein n=1 Tax=Arthrobacter psychrolactophilus TaxID=92442 RepID=A0A2V5J088_9MICC|nr:hypothetical protein CVS30_01315 [Arthrobacter psychrolactophilus]